LINSSNFIRIFEKLDRKGFVLENREVYSTESRIKSFKRSGRYEEAEEEIRLGLEKNPDDLFLKTSLADLYTRQGRLTEGRILAEEVLFRDPQHPQALSVLGDIFLKQHTPKEALECYRQAFNHDPRPYLTLKAARALKELGNHEEALRELEKVLVVKLNHLSCLKEKALILNRMVRFDEALGIYERIKGIAPDDAFVQKEILRLRSLTRPGAQVARELRAVVAMDSKKDDPQIHGLLAQKLKEAGEVREAAAEYGKAVDLEPRNLYFLKQQGFCFYRMKNYEETIRCLSETFRKDPTDHSVRGTLEKSYEALGNGEGFLALLEKTQRQHPDYMPLLGMMKKLRKKLGMT
jgi:tetratricopeptide (TPR) repeat protein